MQKIAIKYWMQKAILHNFVNFSVTICPRLQLNALARRKGCLGRNEGKLLFHSFRYSNFYCYSVIWMLSTLLNLLQKLKASKKSTSFFAWRYYEIAYEILLENSRNFCPYEALLENSEKLTMTLTRNTAQKMKFSIKDFFSKWIHIYQLPSLPSPTVYNHSLKDNSFKILIKQRSNHFIVQSLSSHSLKDSSL